MDKVENFEHAYPPEPLMLVETESLLYLKEPALSHQKIFSWQYLLPHEEMPNNTGLSFIKVGLPTNATAVYPS